MDIFNILLHCGVMIVGPNPTQKYCNKKFQGFFTRNFSCRNWIEETDSWTGYSESQRAVGYRQAVHDQTGIYSAEMPRSWDWEIHPQNGTYRDLGKR